MRSSQGTNALLIGRRTYDIFAAYWPHQDGEDDEIATGCVVAARLGEDGTRRVLLLEATPALAWAGLARRFGARPDQERICP